jgi:hypothetical protein
MLYIKALGFGEYDSKEKAEVLVNKIVKESTTKYISNFNEDKVKVEYYKEFGKNFGLLVRGILNEEEELIIHSLVPYANGREFLDTHEIDVIENDEKKYYSGYCEESKSGTPISFFVQNVIEYLELEEKKDIFIKGVRLVAYSMEGTIILPINKDEDDLFLEEQEDIIREELLEQARLGDEDALSLLEEEAFEASELLQQRMKTEDILSILEGFFVPLGEDEDIYSTLGIIEEVTPLTNRETNEQIYLLKLKCMGLLIDTYINSSDLIGHPTVGMRFKGTSWVHGIIEFDFDEKE